MNTVARNVMSQSTLVSNKLAQRVATHENKVLTDSIPGIIKQQNLSSNLHGINPLFSDPAVKPVIDSVKSQLQLKHPEATTDQLTEMAQDFVTKMAQSLNPTAPVIDPAAPVEPDWGKFLQVE